MLDLESVDREPLIPDRSLERYAVRPGDLLLVARGTLFKLAQVPDQASGYLADANLLILRPDRRKILPEVLLAWFNSAPGRDAVLSRSLPAASLWAITARDLASLRVPVPPMSDQHRIAAIVRATEAGYRAALEAAELRRELGRRAAEHLLLGEGLETPT